MQPLTSLSTILARRARATHAAYISSGKVIGLSKLNPIVQYYAQRPQVHKRLTIKIVNKLKLVLETDEVAVIIDVGASK